LFLVGIEAERDPEVGEGSCQVAFAFIGLGAISVGVEVLGLQPNRGVEFHQSRGVFILRQMVGAESVVHGGIIGIAPEPFVEVLERQVYIAFAEITRSAARIGRHVRRIEPHSLAVVRDCEVVVALEPPVADGAPDVGLAEIGAAQLFCRDQARAGENSILAVRRRRASGPVDGGELLFDARDPFRGIQSRPLPLVRIETERRTEVAERLVELALVLVNLTPGIEGIRVLLAEPERFVCFHQGAREITLLVVIVTKDIVDAGVSRIEPEAFIQIRQRAIDIAFAEVGGGAAGIGAGVFGTEPNCLAEIGDGAVPVTLEAYVGDADIGFGEIAAAQRSRRDQSGAGRQPIVADPLLAGLGVIGPHRRGNDTNKQRNGRSERQQQTVHGVLPRNDGR
jgi:hypothetical protein